LPHPRHLGPRAPPRGSLRRRRTLAGGSRPAEAYGGGAPVSAPAKILAALVAIFAVIQLVPYGRDHKNPPVVKEPAWDRPETRAMAARACFDCHSNETRWPWYANVAPASWLVQHDVEEGRTDLNFSEWNRTFEEANEAPKTVLDGDMPPWTHRL